MNSTLSEVLDAARALSRSERAEVAHELITTLEMTNESDDVHYAELKTAVTVGLVQLDGGEGIEIPSGSLDEYVRGLGQISAERVSRRPM